MTRRSLLALLALLPFEPSIAETPVDEVSPYAMSVSMDSYVLHAPLYRNVALQSQYLFVEHAVVMLHGDARNAAFSHQTLADAAAMAGEGGPSWLFLVPQFLIEDDIEFHALPDDYLFWSDHGWKEGNLSLDTTAHPRPVRVSSFAILDSLLVQTAVLSPNLQSIVVAGHSAGGQFIQRFAAGSVAQQILESEHGVEVKYVVANPSSYLYWNGERVVPGTASEFAVPPPATIEACPGYDDYKYGLLARNAYMDALPAPQLQEQYRDRSVNVLLGELDVDPQDNLLDITCPAELQGAHRFERGVIYHAYLGHFFGASVWVNHETVPVPGVGHDSRAMFTSECGIAQLFETPGCIPIELAAPGGPTVELQAYPNPFRDHTTISFAAAGRACTLAVHDTAGRLVRKLAVPSGVAVASWDGRAADGTALAAGVYFIRLDCSARAARRVVIVR